MNQGTTRTDILELPPELLSKIFTFLPYDEIDTAKIVCTRFNAIGDIALGKGFNWIRRRTVDVWNSSVSYAAEYKRRRRRQGRQTRRSKIMETYWRYRRYQSFSLVIHLSRLFVATFTSLISAGVYPPCPGSLVDLYHKLLRKTTYRAKYVAKTTQRAVYDQTMRYKALCDQKLLGGQDTARWAVLNTILNTLQCFALKDTSLHVGTDVLQYTCSLPGCWLQIFRHNSGNAVGSLSMTELVRTMSCLHSMVTMSIIQYTGADYLREEGEDCLQQWRDCSIFFGISNYSPCYRPLVFDFIIPCPEKFDKKVCDVKSDEFTLTISGPVLGNLFCPNHRPAQAEPPASATYVYQSPRYASSAAVATPCDRPCASCAALPAVHAPHNKRKRLHPVTSSPSASKVPRFH